MLFYYNIIFFLYMNYYQSILLLLLILLLIIAYNNINLFVIILGGILLFYIMNNGIENFTNNSTFISDTDLLIDTTKIHKKKEEFIKQPIKNSMFVLKNKIIEDANLLLENINKPLQNNVFNIDNFDSKKSKFDNYLGNILSDNITNDDGCKVDTDGDEKIVLLNKTRNEPTRMLAGVNNAVKNLNKYVKEEIDEAENMEWWGNNEY